MLAMKLSTLTGTWLILLLAPLLEGASVAHVRTRHEPVEPEEAALEHEKESESEVESEPDSEPERPGANAPRGPRAPGGAVQEDGAVTGRSVIVTDDGDVALCAAEAFKFIDFPDLKGPTVEKAFHYCKQRSSACGHFREVIERAFERDYEGKVYDAKGFCESTEAYVKEIHGAARVPRVGQGTLTDFQLSPHCESNVAAAFAPNTDLVSQSMPDFWYSMCLNQDCAHFLQSRTRWCQFSRTPTHSVSVCEGVRRFAKDEIDVHADSMMSPKQACELYVEFVKEMAEDVQVYNSVMRPNDGSASAQPRRSSATRSGAVAVLLGFFMVVAVSV